MINIEEAIKELEGLKKQWNEKGNELFDHVKSYAGSNDAEYINEFQKKLNTISHENIAVNRDAIAYVAQRGNQAILYLNVTNKDDRLKHLSVDEGYDDVVAMLNS